MYRIEDFVARTYIRNRYPFEGYRATRSSRVPSGWGVANFEERLFFLREVRALTCRVPGLIRFLMYRDIGCT
jgi:hypothetical protein